MDAFTYIKERTRMCKTISDDDGCESCTQYCVCYGLDDATDNDIIEAIVTVEEWAQEHPPETRWTKLKKQYPKITEASKREICVRALGYERQCCDILGCAKCWDEPVDE